MKIPTVRFSSWVKWDERSSIECCDLPGIYVLAHFEKVPTGSANPLSNRTIYVGETLRTLMARWGDFERSAFKGKDGHSGGWTYRQKFKGMKIKLYVACFPVDCLNDKTRPHFIRYIERKFLWEYTKKWRQLPKCNIK